MRSRNESQVIKPSRLSCSSCSTAVKQEWQKSEAAGLHQDGAQPRSTGAWGHRLLSQGSPITACPVPPHLSSLQQLQAHPSPAPRKQQMPGFSIESVYCLGFPGTCWQPPLWTQSAPPPLQQLATSTHLIRNADSFPRGTPVNPAWLVVICIMEVLGPEPSRCIPEY